VERLRDLVDKDIGTLERVAEERGLKSGSGPRVTLASRAMRDLGMMRKVRHTSLFISSLLISSRLPPVLPLNHPSARWNE
jgi:hypothetical protein